MLEARYAEGLASLTDVLQVQADRLAQKTRLRVARVDVARALVELRYAAGAL